MVYFANAIAFAWIASIWSKSGALNIIIAAGAAVLAVINAIGATPPVFRLLQF